MHLIFFFLLGKHLFLGLTDDNKQLGGNPVEASLVTGRQTIFSLRNLLFYILLIRR